MKAIWRFPVVITNEFELQIPRLDTFKPGQILCIAMMSEDEWPGGSHDMALKAARRRGHFGGGGGVGGPRPRPSANMWVKLEEDEHMETRRFRWYGLRREMPDTGEEYIGSVHYKINNHMPQWTSHLFEVL